MLFFIKFHNIIHLTILLLFSTILFTILLLLLFNYFLFFFFSKNCNLYFSRSKASGFRKGSVSEVRVYYG